KERAELAEQSAQERADASGRRPRPRPQQRGHDVLDRLGVERDRGNEGQIAPRVVIAVEEGELLLAVGRVVGRIEIDRDESHVRAERSRWAVSTASASA